MTKVAPRTQTLRHSHHSHDSHWLIKQSIRIVYPNLLYRNFLQFFMSYRIFFSTIKILKYPCMSSASGIPINFCINIRYLCTMYQVSVPVQYLNQLLYFIYSLYCYECRDSRFQILVSRAPFLDPHFHHFWEYTASRNIALTHTHIRSAII